MWMCTKCPGSITFLHRLCTDHHQQLQPKGSHWEAKNTPVVNVSDFVPHQPWKSGEPALRLWAFTSSVQTGCCFGFPCSFKCLSALTNTKQCRWCHDRFLHLTGAFFGVIYVILLCRLELKLEVSAYDCFRGLELGLTQLIERGHWSRFIFLM